MRLCGTPRIFVVVIRATIYYVALNDVQEPSESSESLDVWTPLASETKDKYILLGHRRVCTDNSWGTLQFTLPRIYTIVPWHISPHHIVFVDYAKVQHTLIEQIW